MKNMWRGVPISAASMRPVRGHGDGLMAPASRNSWLRLAEGMERWERDAGRLFVVGAPSDDGNCLENLTGIAMPVKNFMDCL